MAISPQRLTVYLYSAHRAVIFAIAQLSCYARRSLSYNYFTPRRAGLSATAGLLVITSNVIVFKKAVLSRGNRACMPL